MKKKISVAVLIISAITLTLYSIYNYAFPIAKPTELPGAEDIDTIQISKGTLLTEYTDREKIQFVYCLHF